MNCRSLLLLATLAALPVFAFGADEQRPHCDAKHIGQFWPDSKSNTGAVQDSGERGELQVCVRTAEWRYGWQRLTVTVDQIRPEHKKAAAAADSK